MARARALSGGTARAARKAAGKASGPLALLAFAMGAPAPAQLSPDMVDAMVGRWLVLPVDGAPGCVVTLGRARIAGGRVATAAPACATRVPALRGVSAWSAGDGLIRLTNGSRTLMAFDEDETALLSSPSVADPAHYMIPDRPGLTRAPTPASLAGGWTLARPGRPPCRVTLRPAPVPAADRHPLDLGPGCGRIGLRWWRLEALTLYLEGPGDRALALQATADRRLTTDSGETAALTR